MTNTSEIHPTPISATESTYGLDLRPVRTKERRLAVALAGLAAGVTLGWLGASATVDPAATTVAVPASPAAPAAEAEVVVPTGPTSLAGVEHQERLAREAVGPTSLAGAEYLERLATSTTVAPTSLAAVEYLERVERQARLDEAECIRWSAGQGDC